MNGLVITLEEDKRFLCVWLFYYVSNFADSRMEVPRYQSSPTSWDHFFLSVFSSSEVLAKITSIRSKLPTAACWSREEKRGKREANLLMLKVTSVPQTNHSQYSSPVGALNLIVDSKSQPVELDNLTIELHVPSRRKKSLQSYSSNLFYGFWVPCFNAIWYHLWCHVVWWLKFR